MSGPAIHPIAVRMVYEAAHAVKIPVIGMGGISSTDDALEFMLAGASAVSVGTANFYHPTITQEIADGMSAYLDRYHIGKITDLIGAVDS